MNSGQEANPQASDDVVCGEGGPDTLAVRDDQQGNGFVSGGSDSDRCFSDPGDVRIGC